MINFNVPPFTGKETEYIMEAVKAQKICGDGQLQRNVVLGWKKRQE